MTLLERTAASLPSGWYYDPAQYARELEAIWYRDWVCVARQEDLGEPGDYIVAVIGQESVIVTRDRDGRPRAFHNTCRHRGSQLCAAQRGRFAGGRIVCPYHAWSYALSGELLATPKMDLPAEFRREDYALYRVPVDTWGGYLFVNLAVNPPCAYNPYTTCPLPTEQNRLRTRIEAGEPPQPTSAPARMACAPIAPRLSRKGRRRKRRLRPRRKERDHA